MVIRPLVMPLGALVVCLAMTPSAQARYQLVETDAVRLSLEGYAMGLGGVSLSGLEDAAALGFPEELAMGTTVIFGSLRLGLGDRVDLEFGNRLSSTVFSKALGTSGSSPLGLGTSPVPTRWDGLRLDLVEQDTAAVTAEAERLLLALHLGPVDLTLGRQPVTWGRSMLFRPTDLWTALNPLDLDQTQKRGVDAARAVTSLSDTVELEALLVDRDKLDHLSGGLRATFYLDLMDLWAGVARNFDQVLLLTGAAAEVGAFKVRAEGSLGYDEETEDLARPRVTVGIDWFHPRWLVVMELHHNGAGTGDARDYLGHLATDRRLLRGESMFVGKWYGGALISYKPTELITLSATNMTNLGDPSALFSLSAQLDLPQSAQLSLGAMVTAGERPTLDGAATPPLEMGSEFGAYGHLFYLQMTMFL